MRTILLFALAGLLLNCKNAPDLLVPDKNTGQYDDAISAHRGGKDIDGYPENCLETLQYLHEKGVRIFEIDINETRDNVLILLHDSSLNRTSTGEGKISQITYQDSQEYFLKDDFGNDTKFKISTLLEVLNWAKSNDVLLMLDFKSQSVMKTVIREVRAAQMQQKVVLISYSTGAAVRMHNAAPEMKLSVAMRNMREFNSMMDSGIPAENMIAFTGTRLSKPELYTAIKAEGIPTILGTLGNLDRRAEARGDKLYADWKALGIDIFATDRPLAVQKALHGE